LLVASPLSSCLELDTRIDKREEVRGALELIVAEEQLELLMLPRVVELLRKKWSVGVFCFCFFALASII
jgi:hypothetical protein